MQLTQEEFVVKVLGHLSEEHGCSPSVFDDLREKIAACWSTEGVAITPEELNALAHGQVSEETGEIATPTHLENKYPRLGEIFTLAYGEVDDDAEEDENDDIDEDDDEEGDEEGEEDEDGAD
jgi:hypothetical protein